MGLLRKHDHAKEGHMRLDSVDCVLSIYTRYCNRWYHLLTEQPLVANVDNNVVADSASHLIALGYMDESEYYEPDAGTFLPYQNEPGRNWLTVNCLTEFRGKVYSWGTRLESLDPATWTWRDEKEDLPQALYTPGRCSGTRIGGESVLFTRLGFYYNLERETFEQVSDLVSTYR